MVKLRIVVSNNGLNLVSTWVFIHRCRSNHHGKNIQKCTCHLIGKASIVRHVIRSKSGTEYHEVKDGKSIRYVLRQDFLSYRQIKTLKYKLHNNEGAKRLISKIEAIQGNSILLLNY
ncbi:MAG: hypothetical protein AAB614_03365 [Patescibacteria group bacterium]